MSHNSTKTEQKWLSFESRITKNTDKILELLDTKRQKATFFCLGWIARRHPEIIKKIAKEGHDVASHSDMHQLVFEQSVYEFKDDIVRSIKSIEDILGKKVRAYRAPGFSLNEKSIWAFEVLIENGIEIDSSVFPVKRAHGGFRHCGFREPVLIDIGGHKIKEFPINFYWNIVFSGGGYFRLFPYWAIRFMTNNSHYVMTYFHPRDFDSTQPRISDLPFMRRFRSYYGLSGCFDKLNRFLDDFDFADLQTADRSVSWDSVKTVKLHNAYAPPS